MDWRELKLTEPERRFYWLCDIIAHYEPAYRYRPDVNGKISHATERFVQDVHQKILSSLDDYRQGRLKHVDQKIPDEVNFRWGLLINALYPHGSLQEIEAIVPVLHEFAQNQVEERRSDFLYETVSVTPWHPFLLVSNSQDLGLHYHADLSASVELDKKVDTTRVLTGLAIPVIFDENDHCLIIPETVMNRACRRIFSMDDPPLQPAIFNKGGHIHRTVRPISGNLSPDREKQYYDLQLREIKDYLEMMRGVFPDRTIRIDNDFSYVLRLSREDRGSIVSPDSLNLG